jgi:hypothetical protein
MPTKTLKINENRTIPCPQCGHDFVHFPKIHFDLRNMKDLTVNHDGEVTVVTEKDGSGEHYDIALRYTCEVGHTGIIRISHHEGTAYIEHEVP